MAWKKKFKNVKVIATQLEEKDKEKLVQIAELEDRDMSSQVRYFIKQGIKRYIARENHDSWVKETSK